MSPRNIYRGALFCGSSLYVCMYVCMYACMWQSEVHVICTCRLREVAAHRVHTLTYSLIHVHTLTYSLIHVHTLTYSLIRVHSLTYSLIHVHVLPWLHTLTLSLFCGSTFRPAISASATCCISRVHVDVCMLSMSAHVHLPGAASLTKP